MDRRSFVKAAALTGLAVTAPLTWHRDASAGSPYAGPYLVLVHAAGGWDPRFMFDPTLDKGQNRIYTQIKQVGNIKYADIPVDAAAVNIDPNDAQFLMSNEQFLQKFGSKMTVINGIDCETNGHDAGTRANGCGRIGEGFPALGALMAAAKAPDKPVAFMSSRGFDATQNLVPLTRISNVSSLRKIAYPNVIDVSDIKASSTYHTPDTYGRIAQAHLQRLERQQKAQRLPRLRQAIGSLHAARLTDNELTQLEIPQQLITLQGNNVGDLQGMMQQTQLAMAAFKSGLAAAVNVGLGGFDTHGNHDSNQRRQLQKLLSGINYIMDEANAQGIGDKVFVVAVSDFGRSPNYNGPNDNDGKDHWSITSMFAMGPGIAGNRVIGATDGAQKPLNVDPGSLKTLSNSKDGKRIRPSEVHHALRAKLGIAGSEPANKFPLSTEEPLPLFG